MYIYRRDRSSMAMVLKWFFIWREAWGAESTKGYFSEHIARVGSNPVMGVWCVDREGDSYAKVCSGLCLAFAIVFILTLVVCRWWWILFSHVFIPIQNLLQFCRPPLCEFACCQFYFSPMWCVYVSKTKQ